MTTNTTTTTDRFLTVPELIERWPIGRNSTYALIKSPEFPRALVLLRQHNGQPRSLGYREADIVAFEEAHMVHASELDLGPENVPKSALEPVLPPAKRARPRRRAR